MNVDAGSESAVDNLITTINTSPTSLCDLSDTACTYLNSNGYNTSSGASNGGCAHTSLTNIDNPSGCPPSVAVEDTFYMQLLVAKGWEDVVCPTEPENFFLTDMALLLQSDFNSGRFGSIQPVKVTAENAFPWVSLWGLAPEI